MDDRTAQSLTGRVGALERRATEDLSGLREHLIGIGNLPLTERIGLVDALNDGGTTDLLARGLDRAGALAPAFEMLGETGTPVAMIGYVGASSVPIEEVPNNGTCINVEFYDLDYRRYRFSTTYTAAHKSIRSTDDLAQAITTREDAKAFLAQTPDSLPKDEDQLFIGLEATDELLGHVARVANESKDPDDYDTFYKMYLGLLEARKAVTDPTKKQAMMFTSNVAFQESRARLKKMLADDLAIRHIGVLSAKLALGPIDINEYVNPVFSRLNSWRNHGEVREDDFELVAEDLGLKSSDVRQALEGIITPDLRKISGTPVSELIRRALSID